MPTLPPFEQVVAEQGPVVLRVCRALLAPADAEDAWSETFLAALQAYPRLRTDSNIQGWLVTIAHRKAVDRIRAAARAPLPVSETDQPDRPERSGAGQRRGLDRPPGAEPERPSDRDPQLWAALQALPFKQRAAVTYHYLAGMPYAEIGPMIGSSEAAARRSAADGIASLRARYPNDRTGTA
jgi:RNA polymerase sigma factor (sigma-70 family)